MFICEITGCLCLPDEGWRPQRFAVMGRNLQEVFAELAVTDCFKAMNKLKRPAAGTIISAGAIMLKLGKSGYSEVAALKRLLINDNLYRGDRSGSAPYQELFDDIIDPMLPGAPGAPEGGAA